MGHVAVEQWRRDTHWGQLFDQYAGGARGSAEAAPAEAAPPATGVSPGSPLRHPTAAE